ncbi:Crp/Fnr family transcriptional regulator [Nocardioides alcanivorans]|uniref:Crp/Fnr family transcriptional regulator n=1 Tax=Nocardioides alcanivorans TaxID=2897352 RepID=UPI001F213E40|nr:Crp/Fnr family transcriptional regulator [Nocardioides alcanivorans]
MASKQEHLLNLVRRVPIFSGLPVSAQRQIASTAVTRPYQRDERIYGPGDRTGLFVVHSGLVKVHRLTESGSDQLIRLMSPGDFLGETALLAGTATDHFAVALQPSELCMIDRDRFTRLLGEHPSIAVQMLQTVSTRLVTTEQMLSSLGGHSVRHRLAQQLLLLMDEAGSTSFRLPTTKKELAAYLGTSPETLSRRLTALQDAGVIRLGAGGLVEVVDRKALEQATAG